jgi:chorismate mutase
MNQDENLQADPIEVLENEMQIIDEEIFILLGKRFQNLKTLNKLKFNSGILLTDKEEDLKENMNKMLKVGKKYQLNSKFVRRILRNINHQQIKETKIQLKSLNAKIQL